jgi:hypothetical protein
MKLTADDKSIWIKSYTTTGKLPNTKVPCTRCGTDITMFSTNLTARVAKFGGIKNLLDTFVCKTCTRIEKPRKVYVPKRVPRVKKDDAPVVYDIPKFVRTEPKFLDVNDKLDPNTIKSITSGVCYRPQVYLNNDRTCGDCNLFAHCACAIKRKTKWSGYVNK